MKKSYCILIFMLTLCLGLLVPGTAAHADSINCGYGVVATKNDPLNVREYPTTSARILGSIPRGERILYDDISNGFVHIVDYNGLEGWCSLNYVDIIQEGVPFWLDEVIYDSDGGTKISGWALSPDNSGVEFYLYYNSNWYYIRPDLLDAVVARGDVLEYFSCPNYDENCGFEISITRLSVKELSSTRLGFVSNGACSITEPLINYIGGTESESREVCSDETYKAWSQSDSRWGGIKIGSTSKTVAQVGCAVTACNKLAIQAGVKPATYSPESFIKEMNVNGFSGASIRWGKAVDVLGFSDCKILAREVRNGSYKKYYTNDSCNTDRLLKWLEDGYYIILCVPSPSGSGDHWVAVDRNLSLASHRIYIMDSLRDTSGNAEILLSSRYAYYDVARGFLK